MRRANEIGDGLGVRRCDNKPLGMAGDDPDREAGQCCPDVDVWMAVWLTEGRCLGMWNVGVDDRQTDGMYRSAWAMVGHRDLRGLSKHRNSGSVRREASSVASENE
jgi:hypothetical protein